jgi:hypothetical protein
MTFCVFQSCSRKFKFLNNSNIRVPNAFENECCINVILTNTMQRCNHSGCQRDRAPKGDGTYFFRCSEHHSKEIIRQREARKKKRSRSESEVSPNPAPTTVAVQASAEREMVQARQVEDTAAQQHVNRKVDREQRGDWTRESMTENIQSTMVSRLESEVNAYREKYVEGYRKEEQQMKAGNLFRIWKNRLYVPNAKAMLANFPPHITLAEWLQDDRESYREDVPMEPPPEAHITDVELERMCEQIGRGTMTPQFRKLAIQEEHDLRNRIQKARNWKDTYVENMWKNHRLKAAARLEAYALMHGSFPPQLSVVATGDIERVTKQDELSGERGAPAETYVVECQVVDATDQLEKVPMRVGILFGMPSPVDCMQSQWDAFIDSKKFEPLDKLNMPPGLLAGLELQKRLTDMPRITESHQKILNMTEDQLLQNIRNNTNIPAWMAKLNTNIMQDWLLDVYQLLNKGGGVHLSVEQRTAIDERERCVQDLTRILEGNETRAAVVRQDRRGLSGPSKRVRIHPPSTFSVLLARTTPN